MLSIFHTNLSTLLVLPIVYYICYLMYIDYNIGFICPETIDHNELSLSKTMRRIFNYYWYLYFYTYGLDDLWQSK